MWKHVNLEELYIDNDRYEDKGYTIFVDGMPELTLDDHLDIVIAKADTLEGEVLIREFYFDSQTNDDKYGDILWVND